MISIFSRRHKTLVLNLIARLRTPERVKSSLKASNNVDTAVTKFPAREKVSMRTRIIYRKLAKFLFRQAGIFYRAHVKDSSPKRSKSLSLRGFDRLKNDDIYHKNITFKALERLHEHLQKAF